MGAGRVSRACRRRGGEALSLDQTGRLCRAEADAVPLHIVPAGRIVSVTHRERRGLRVGEGLAAGRRGGIRPAIDGAGLLALALLAQGSLGLRHIGIRADRDGEDIPADRPELHSRGAGGLAATATTARE